jgi:signal transduction histidine kinase/CheY-like chemotaxis protein
MSGWLQKKFESVRPVHLVWITVLASEILTAVLSSIVGIVFFGAVNTEVLITGAFDAFVVSLVMASMVVYFLNRLRDIAEERRIEEERAKAQRLESIGLLAGGIAHDFNNALTAVLNTIALARSHIEPESRAFTKLTEAEDITLKAQSLTRQLLTFSKGGAPVRKAESLRDIITETADFALRGSNAVCEYSLDDGLWHVYVDAGQISQVVNNLIINAVQAMPGGGTIMVWAGNVNILAGELPGLAEGRYVKLAVQDNGSGIPLDDINRVFDPYFTTKAGGSGLGLATTYSIVNNHGGYITVSSGEGKGASFYVYLPATTERALQQKAVEKKSYPEGGKLLFMDDDKLIRDSVGELLRTRGYEVVCAQEGSEAIRLYQEEMDSGRPFDAVVLDLTVRGGMGGLATLNALREMAPRVKAVVSSGYSNDPVMSDFSRYGFNAGVDKPYRIETLDSVLKSVIHEAGG